MDLLTRFLAARRDRLLMRLGCWLVCFSLILGLMLPQQRAEAAAGLSMAAVASVAAAYLSACGLNFVTQGMDKTALVNSVQRLIQEYLSTELGGISIQDWLGGVWDLVVLAGELVLGRSLTEKLMGFAQWVAQQYATQVGMNIIYEGKEGYPHLVYTGSYAVWDYPYSVTFSAPTVNVHGGYAVNYYDLKPGNYVVFTPHDFASLENGRYFYLRSATVFHVSSVRTESTDQGVFRYFSVSEADLSKSPYVAVGVYWAGEIFDAVPGSSFPISLDYCYIAYADADMLSESLSVDRAESMSYIPDDIAAEQGIALGVGAAATMDLAQVLQGVLDDVLAGTLTATMEAAGEKADEEEKPVVIPDVGELGLPSLGQALTSRFPFSIPWDFFRAVKLLAAPAKAPYFEVDFMEPLADEVGGWKGSTTVVLDFEQYAIIGQVSRWTSTIGFCLMLAGATKRLIWTA